MLNLALILFASAGAPQARPSQDGLAAVRAVLQRTEGSKRAPDDVLVRRLVALGSGAAPALFSLVTGAGIEGLFVDDAPEAWLCPPDRVTDLALAALADLPEVPVRSHLRAACSEHPDRTVRSAALQVLARRGSPEGFELWLELCTESGDELEHRSLHVPAAAAFTAMFKGEGKAPGALEGTLLKAPLTVLRVAADALAACPRNDSIALLMKLFGRDAELDLIALESLTLLGEHYPWLAGEPVTARLRAALEHGEGAVRPAAARGLGRTLDVRSLPSLIAATADADRATARAASWALRTITGKKDLATRDAWLAWLQGEREWWRAAGEGVLAALEPDSTNLTMALRELTDHPLARDEVCEKLTGALAALEPGAQVVASQALACLQARRSVPFLVELLRSTDPGVRDAAYKALRTLTSADLPAEPQLWEDFVAGS